MAASRPAAGSAGFTLIEVLASLGLCALLATATAGAVAFAARAERQAAREGAAALLLQSLYAAQRLRPAEPPAAPRGWQVARDGEIVRLSDDLRQEWHVLAVRDETGETRSFAFRILDDVP
ncbi:MAG: prepilin-type N-terminal cleavage/methylation domain-containing protein [Kiritimatiellia bacterium]